MSRACCTEANRYLSLSFSSFFWFLSDLWNTYGDCNNFGVIKGHIGAILELHWSRDGRYGDTSEQETMNWAVLDDASEKSKS